MYTFHIFSLFHGQYYILFNEQIANTNITEYLNLLFTSFIGIWQKIIVFKHFYILIHQNKTLCT